MAIKSMTSLATGVLIALWMWVLGVDYALLWGLLAFLLNYIPNIGSIIAAIPAVLLALVTGGPVTRYLGSSGYLLVNTLVGNVIEPKFLGDRLGLSRWWFSSPWSSGAGYLVLPVCFCQCH